MIGLQTRNAQGTADNASHLKYLPKIRPLLARDNSHAFEEGYADQRDSCPLPAAGEAAPGHRDLRRGIRRQAREPSLRVKPKDYPRVA